MFSFESYSFSSFKVATLSLKSQKISIKKLFDTFLIKKKTIHNLKII